MKNFFKNTTAILRRFAEADTVFFLLPPLMLLLLAGTLAQKWMGLYMAQKLFFGSAFFWLGPIPVPSGYTLLGLLSMGLALKFLLKSEWSWRRAGIILTHLGALLLLLGGLVTAWNAHETFMTIPEGQKSSHSYDYHRKSLMIYEEGRLRQKLAFEDIGLWPGTALPFHISILEFCENCSIENVAKPPAEARSMARFMALKSRPPEKEPEANFSGFTAQLSGTGHKSTDGVYVFFDAMPKPVQFKKDGKVFELIFGKNQYGLPFSLELTRFEKDLYPGTDKPRAFSSDLVIHDGKLSWPVRIEMNKPLRYRGYTFFQSSFAEDEKGQATILAVVQNKGRLVPYIASALIAAGLLLQSWISIRGRS